MANQFFRKIYRSVAELFWIVEDPPARESTPQQPDSNFDPVEEHAEEPRTSSVKQLNNISDIRRFFHRNETPIYFVSATNFNLLGISEWVRNFRYINYIDCFDGRHPNVRIPKEQPHR